MRTLVVASLLLSGALLSSCGGSDSNSTTTGSRDKATYSVNGEALTACNRGGDSNGLSVAHIRCSDVPSDLEVNVTFAQTDVLGTQPRKTIRKRLRAQVLKTSDGWNCEGTLSGSSIDTTCWRGAAIVRFQTPAP
jgi:hypothetical protein